jgi:hypothetical protein
MNDMPFPETVVAERLAASVEGNLHALFRQLGRLTGAQLVEKPRLALHNTPFTNPMFRAVLATQLDENDVDEVIAQALSWFQERHAPFVF